MFRGIGRLRAGGGFSYIATLFASTGANGFWFDESDFSTLFQDTSGVTAVTAVGQPIGLMLDKHLGSGISAEIAANVGGPFTATTGFTTTGSLAVVSGKLRITNDSAVQKYAAMAFSTVSGKTYRITVTGAVSSAATPSLWASATLYGTQVGLINAPGTMTTVYTATTATSYATLAVNSNNINDYAEYATISIKELIGNFATQATAANRLILQQDASGFYYAAANGTNQNITTTTGGGGATGFFFCQVINPAGSAGTARTLFSDRGTNTGYRVGINVSNQLELSAGNGTAFTAIATVATLGVGSTQLVTAWDDGANLNVQVGGNTVASVARPTVSAGTAATTIASDNGAATGFFYGNLYPEVYGKNTAFTAAQRLLLQNSCKSKAGL
jgi:hypothetical protein